MQILNRLYGWYGKRIVLGFFGLVMLIAIVGIFLNLTTKETPAAETEENPTVEVRSVRELGAGTSFDVIGTVTAVSEAQLQTEAGGRITSVTAELGDTVTAGTVIASIENASEAAALLQAEGAYESAETAAQSSGISLQTAELNIENLYRDSFTTADSIVRNTIDQIFSNPRSSSPGLRINGSGRANELSETRTEIETMLEMWSDDVQSDLSNLGEERMLDTAEQNLKTLSEFIATLSFLLANETPNEIFSETELGALRSTFSAARASIDASLSGVVNSRREYAQAKVAIGGETVTESSARLKSALGTLRAAQAAYEKTLVRTPITGTINALYLKAGTYVAPGTPAVIIANNGSLEITTAVSAEESNAISVGDEVVIEGTATGIVTAIAPAIDPQTGKIAVKISVTDERTLENGSTVRVSFVSNRQETEMSEILIPLTSLKITPQGSVVFTVDETNVLTPVSVTLGEVRGAFVVIDAGLTSDTEIVVDARGLKEGEKVTRE